MSLISQLVDDIIATVPSIKWIIANSETVLDTKKLYIVMYKVYINNVYDTCSISLLFYHNPEEAWYGMNNIKLNLEQMISYVELELPKGYKFV